MKNSISLVILMLLLSNSMSQNSPQFSICDSGLENIRETVERLERFRSVYAFDPANPSVILSKYQEYVTYKDEDAILIKIDEIEYSEEYIIANRMYITQSGKISINNSYYTFTRNLDGILVKNNFDDQFTFLLPVKPNLGVDIPETLQPEYKDIANAMDLFHNKSYSIKEIINRVAPNVTIYEFNKLTEGFVMMYHEAEASILQDSQDQGETITGTYKCGRLEQQYIIRNGVLELVIDDEDDDEKKSTRRKNKGKRQRPLPIP